MGTEKIAYPSSERSRTLQQLAFSASTILSRDLPRDTVLKSLAFRMSGSVVTTFASGTPVADVFSTFDALVPRIDVVVNGSRVVKSVRPHMMKVQQLLTTNIVGERASSAGAAASVYPTVDGGFAYGTTGQISSVRETIVLSFEMVYADPGLGRESTWLNLKGVASAEVRLTTNAFSALLGFGNTAPVVYSSNLIVIDIVTKEAQDVPPQIMFSDWKQTVKALTYSAQQSGAIIDINRGNNLTGIMFMCQDGAAGSTTTATGKLLSNTALTDIQLLVNGQTTIKRIPGLAYLNAQNRAEYGVYAPMASNVSILDGIGHLNLLARKDLSTALPVKPPSVDNVQLVINTDNSTNVSYTNPITVTVMTEEIVEPR
jgi:hypothetical protein